MRSQHGHGEDNDLGVGRLPEVGRRHVYGVESQCPAAHGRSAGKTSDVVAGLPQSEAERAADQPEADNGYSCTGLLAHRHPPPPAHAAANDATGRGPGW